MPWTNEPTATVIVDCYRQGGEAVAHAPRQVLKRILKGGRSVLVCLLQRREEGLLGLIAPNLAERPYDSVADLRVRIIQ